MLNRKLQTCFLLICLIIFWCNISIAIDNLAITPVISLLLLSDEFSTPSDPQDEVIVLGEDDTNAVSFIDPVANDQTLLQLDGELAKTVKEGLKILILPGIDNRFPFGLTGKISSETTNVDGTKDITLDEVTYSDVIQESNIDMSNVTLDASNFIGVIAPTAVQSADTAISTYKVSVSSQDIIADNEYSFRNGAIVVRVPSTISNVMGVTPTSLDINNVEIQESSTVSLNMKVDLADIGVKSSTMKPVDENTSVGFVIRGEMSNLMLKRKLKYIGGLNSFVAQLDGDIDIDVKFFGIGSATFGYYSQAWEEVKDEYVKVLGITTNLSGLDVEDKIGKIPLAGLVWSLNCPETCYILPLKTQTPLRQAKSLGIIVWIYLNIDGEITVDGDLHLAQINAGHLSLGMEKDDDSSLTIQHSLKSNIEGERFIEAPSLNGSFGFGVFAGTSIDLDVFMSGIYVANAGTDIGFKADLNLSGEINYGTYSLDLPWTWQGSACFDANYGGGAIFRAGARFGIAVNTSWPVVSNDYTYHIQIPSDAVMNTPGWHGAWYTADGEYECWPPVSLIPLNDTGITYGGNYPVGNNLDCSGVEIGAQDCWHGRDATENDPDDGKAGFSYTKISSTGEDLPATAMDWACIRDNVTGLMWEKKTVDGGLHDGGWEYSWHNSDPYSNGGSTGVEDGTSMYCYIRNCDIDHPENCNRCTTEKFVEDVNAAGLCGYTDWRMPTVKELHNIVDYGHQFPSIDTAFFPNTGEFLWTATPSSSDSEEAWDVSFQHGGAGTWLKSENLSVRLVRNTN